MAVLVFDTSGPFCAVGVVVDGTLTAWAAEPMTTGQSEALFGMIEGTLANAGVARGDIGLIVAGTGPGNFTGTRIGVAAARGLALALGCRSVGVSRLTALGAPAAVAAHRGKAWLARGGETPGLVEQTVLEDVAGLCVDDTLSMGTVLPRDALLLRMAELGTALPDNAPPPAPLYLRAPDAALPADPPPVILP